MNFQELMDCYYISEEENNQIVYNQLLSLIRKQNITPFIGAGLSSWTYPLWSEMLKKQVKNYGFEQECNTMLERQEYEEVVSLLEKELTHNGMVRLLQQIFRPSLIKENIEKCPKYLRKLPQLFQGPIITTNFDCVIEYLFKLEGILLSDIVTPSNLYYQDKLEYALHQSETILIKMHGDIKDIEHLVLTKESYNNTYGDNPTSPDLHLPMPSFLYKVLTRNPLLFLGCSLGTDRTCAIIKACAHNHQKFAFLELPKATKNQIDYIHPILRETNQKIKSELRERLNCIIGDYNILPIWYPNGMHNEAFEVFFTQLSEDLNIRSSQYYLINKVPKDQKYFDGRDDDIERIHAAFENGNHILFVKGIGGIGKSELVKQFIARYKFEYKNIIFTTYNSSLEQLICDPTEIIIENLVMTQSENEQTFFQRKLQLLQKITDHNTLIVVDNFDTDDDPRLKEFIAGNYRVIFTTRNAHPEYLTIEIDPIDDINILFHIFENNYGSSIKEEDTTYLKDIFRLLENHTYAIELIAKQMAASFLSAQTILEYLKKGKFRAMGAEIVIGKNGQNTAFGHICSLFDISNLDKEEKKVIMYLSLMGIQGVTATYFKIWAELSSFEIINRLIKRGWIRKKDEEKLSLHPLVQEVAYVILSPNITNCWSFLYKIAEFCCGAWIRNYKENMKVTNNILSLLNYFDSDSWDYQIFDPFVGFLWQVGKFDYSIQYAKELYYSCLRKFGEASLETGFVAKTVGGCYFNSGFLKESIPWYKQGLKCMLLANKAESEDLAMSYEKVARCYTWKFEQNFKKAEEYFEIALQIRRHLRDAFKHNQPPQLLLKYERYDLNKAEERIGETYMEIGRMYQLMKEYKKALDYAKKYEERLLMYSSHNITALAYTYYDQGICHYQLGLLEKEANNEETTLEEWKQAGEYLKKALNINKQMRGELALDTIDSHESLADIYLEIANELYKKAINEFMEAKDTAKKLIGENCEKVQLIEQKIPKFIYYNSNDE